MMFLTVASSPRNRETVKIDCLLSYCSKTLTHQIVRSGVHSTVRCQTVLICSTVMSVPKWLLTPALPVWSLTARTAGEILEIPIRIEWEADFVR